MSSNAVSSRLLTGGILKALSTVCNVAVAFFLMPYIIHSLGDRQYGFWTIIATFAGYYGFLDLGLASATGRYVARAIGRSSDEETNEAINTSFVLYCYIGIIALFFTVVAITSCQFFIIDKAEVRLFRIVLLILGPSLALSFPVRAFAGVLTGYLRYDLAVLNSLAKTLLRAGMIFLALKADYGIIGLAAITSITDMLAYGVTFFWAKRLFAALNISFSSFSKDLLTQYWNYSFKTFIAQLGGILRFRVDSFVIAGFLNLQVVTHYAIASRLIEYFISLVSNVMGTILPVFSQQEGRSDYDAIRRTFILSTRLASVMAIFIGGMIMIVGKAFIIRWMGHDYLDAYPVMVTLTFSTTFALMQVPSLSLLYGISRHGYFAVANTSEGILNFLLSIVLVRHYGILGVAFGTAIPMLLFKLIFQPVYSCKQISIPMGRYYFTVLAPALFTLGGAMCVLWYFSRFYLEPNYFSIVSYGLCGSVFYFIISFYLFLKKEERLYFYTYFNKMILKMRGKNSKVPSVL